VSVNGTALERTDIYDTTRTLRLGHLQNTLTIAYAPIQLINAAALRYEVMLQGHDEHWSSNGSARTATYVNLAPGEYTLAIRIAGSSDEAHMLRLRFHIVPAFWQTWWFRLGLVVVLLTGAILLTRYILDLRYRERIAALLREQEVQGVRMRIARDIHDGIGSGLTKITLLGRRIPDDRPDGIGSRIAEASTELVHELSEIVWTVDPKNDSRSSFIAFVRNTIGRQFDDLDVRLFSELQVDEESSDRPIGPELKRNTTLILKEAVNNALKHAKATEVHIRLHLGPDHLELEVRDNGVGFDSLMRSGSGNGLANFVKRAEAVQGQVEVHSAPGQGTRVVFTAPMTPTFM
jgi:signal transduction histidine kinase